jgi:hypothetical protein
MRLKYLKPDLVYLSDREFELFTSGKLKQETKINVGVNSSVKLILTITGIGPDFYECVDNYGKVYAIEWNLDEFYKKQKEMKQTVLCFYNILKYGN